MKILFLDINGVLFLTTDEVTLDYVTFNSECMKNLKKIIDSTFCNIVLTSTWRTGYNDPSNFYWKAILTNFEKYNIEDKIIGSTPILTSNHKEVSRGLEINQWLNQNSNIDNYVILDDDKIFDVDESKMLLCDSFLGIDSHTALKAIKILNS